MKIQASCVINAPKSEVFNTFSDVSHLSELVTAITDIEVLTPGVVGVGCQFKETRVMFGKESSEVMEVTEFNAPHSFKEEAQSHGMHYSTEWTFTGDEDQTQVSIEFTGNPQTLMAKFFNLIFSFMASSMKKAFIADMNDLKGYLEQPVAETNP